MFMGTLAGIAMALLAAWATGAGTRGGLLLDGLFSPLGSVRRPCLLFIFGAFMVLPFATWLNWLPAARLETLPMPSTGAGPRSDGACLQLSAGSQCPEHHYYRHVYPDKDGLRP
ncbi:MAG: hypothetical protein R2857_11870 [Vampirovibrionales bacterium]